MKKLTFGVALAALYTVAPGVASAQNAGPVLVVDIARITSECTACRAASSQLQSQVTSYQQRQQQLAQQLQTAGQPLQTALGALNGKAPDAALQSRVQAFETQRNNAAQEIQNRGQQLESTEAHVNQQIAARLRTVLEQIRSTRNAAVIVPRAATWAHSPAADVTDQALAALNQQLPSVNVTPLPQQQQQQQQRPQGR